jgi:uncharacterized protein YjbI with pentapeptide repeats
LLFFTKAIFTKAIFTKAIFTKATALQNVNVEVVHYSHQLFE